MPAPRPGLYHGTDKLPWTVNVMDDGKMVMWKESSPDPIVVDGEREKAHISQLIGDGTLKHSGPHHEQVHVEPTKLAPGTVYGAYGDPWRYRVNDDGSFTASKDGGKEVMVGEGTPAWEAIKAQMPGGPNPILKPIGDAAAPGNPSEAAKPPTEYEKMLEEKASKAPTGYEQRLEDVASKATRPNSDKSAPATSGASGSPTASDKAAMKAAPLLPGMAVPPALGYAVGRKVAGHIAGEPQSQRERAVAAASGQGLGVGLGMAGLTTDDGQKAYNMVQDNIGVGAMSKIADLSEQQRARLMSAVLPHLAPEDQDLLVKLKARLYGAGE